MCTIKQKKQRIALQDILLSLAESTIEAASRGASHEAAIVKSVENATDVITKLFEAKPEQQQ